MTEKAPAGPDGGVSGRLIVLLVLVILLAIPTLINVVVGNLAHRKLDDVEYHYRDHMPTPGNGTYVDGEIWGIFEYTLSINHLSETHRHRLAELNGVDLDETPNGTVNLVRPRLKWWNLHMYDDSSEFMDFLTDGLDEWENYMKF